jgi:hypothetical protein
VEGVSPRGPDRRAGQGPAPRKSKAVEPDGRRPILCRPGRDGGGQRRMVGPDASIRITMQRSPGVHEGLGEAVAVPYHDGRRMDPVVWGRQRRRRPAGARSPRAPCLWATPAWGALDAGDGELRSLAVHEEVANTGVPRRDWRVKNPCHPRGTRCAPKAPQLPVAVRIGATQGRQSIGSRSRTPAPCGRSEQAAITFVEDAHTHGSQVSRRRRGRRRTFLTGGHGHLSTSRYRRAGGVGSI